MVGGILFETAQSFRKSELLNGKPETAVTSWIERACDPRMADAEVVGIIPELVAVINLQSTGPTEASRAIRKKLKYGDVHRQLRAIQLLESLVLNCGERFQTTFANERLVDRIKIMAGDPQTDAAVKKRIMVMLASWNRTFASDARMSLVSGLYAACGGGQAARAREAKEAYQKEQERLQREEQERRDKKTADKMEKEQQKQREAEEKRRRKMKPAPPTQGQRRPFILANEKPLILESVAMASQSANNLVNSIQHVNREQTSILTDPKVQLYLTQTKEARRKVVRFTQLVPDQDVDGEFLGMLLNTNEQVMAALSLYDRMSKPVELDSDDERDVERLAAAGRSRGDGTDLVHDEPSLLSISPGDTTADDESVRARMEAASLYDSRIGEVAKLQDRQRRAIVRHNSVTQHSTGGGYGYGSDLAGLDFGGPSTLPAPIEPQYGGQQRRGSASARGGGVAAAATGGATGGALSDYSDYDSSDDDDGLGVSSPPLGSRPAALAPAAHHSGAGRTYDPYLNLAERDGPAHRGLLDDDADDGGGGDAEGVDPFADEFETGRDDVGTPGIHQKRMAWAEV